MRTLAPHRSRLAALIACVCLGAQAFAIAHLFLVVHERCAEHGAVEHGHGHGHAGDDHARLSGDAATGHAAAHDHCQTFAERRDIGAERGVVAVVPCTIVIATSPRLELALPSQRLYLLAPKASPPRAIV